MFCSECGKKNIDNAKFCVECGTAISTKVKESADSKVNLNLNTKKDYSENSRVNRTMGKLNENSDFSKQKIEQKLLFDSAMTEMMETNEKVMESAKVKARSDLDENTKIKTTISKERDAKNKPLQLISVIFFGGSILAGLFYIPHSISSYGFIATLIGYIAGLLALVLIAVVGEAIFFVRDPNLAFSPQNPHMKCNHCGTIGQIITKKVDLTKGISGGKAVAGLLTGGLSILAVGISRKEEQTEARCGKCGNVWHF